MKAQVPFTDYDFYAYLTSGLTFILALSAGLFKLFPNSFLEISHELVASQTPIWLQAIIVGILAYVAGQIFASVSGQFLERYLIGWVGHPRDVLMGPKDSRDGLRRLLA